MKSPGRPGRGPVEVRRRRAGVPFAARDAAFDLAHREEVLVQLAPVRRAQRPAQAAGVSQHDVEDAAVVAPLPGADGRIPLDVLGAKEALERGPRAGFERHRRRGGPPRDAVAVGATVAAVAVAAQQTRLAAELERAEARLAAEVPRRDLVGRDPGVDVGAVGLPRVDAGEVARPGPRVVAGTVAERAAPVVREPAQDRDVVPVGSHRLQHAGQRRRQRSDGTIGRGRPLVHDDAVRHVDEDHPVRRRGGVRRARERRHHGVEERQRQRGADAAEDGPSRKGSMHRHDSRPCSVEAGGSSSSIRPGPGNVVWRLRFPPDHPSSRRLCRSTAQTPGARASRRAACGTARSRRHR